ncbi:hypothetical protein SLS60_003860 [Paraconiothyrium brasiliense]|uniref:Ankyrin repeat protein n=1 Tax=Paraconiothyrium brasiliense TaxID=300254 RepID=A0ABR3RPV8_9PLEO
MRTFAAEIEYDIFAKQCKEAFEGTNNYTILLKKIWLYLFYQSKFRNPEHPLCNAINNMITFLGDEMAITTEAGLLSLREALCKAASVTMDTRHLPKYRGQLLARVLGFKTKSVWNVHEMMKAQVSTTTHYQSKLGAASAVGNIKMVKTLLLENRPNTAECFVDNSIFGNPIHNAVALGNIEMLTAISESLKAIPRAEFYSSGDLGSYMSMNFTRALQKAANANRLDMVQILFDMHHARLRIEPSVFTSWVTIALRSCNDKLLDMVFDVKFPTDQKIKIELEVFQLACEASNANAVAKLIRHPAMGPNHVWRTSTPLLVAVKEGSAEVVQSVLRSGAVVNGVPVLKYRYSEPFYETVKPIAVAMNRGNTEVIQVLLDNGAQLRGLIVASENKAVYNMLREAKMQATGTYVPTYAWKYRKSEEMDLTN